MIIKKTLEAQFKEAKERYNPYQGNTGIIKTAKDKLLDRNSKFSKILKKEMNNYCR